MEYSCRQTHHNPQTEAGFAEKNKNKINSHKLKIVAEAIFSSKMRYGMSVFTIPKFEFNNLEQTIDSNIAKLQIIQNDMIRLLIGKNRNSKNQYGENQTST